MILALDKPTLDHKSTEKAIIFWIDTATIVVFTSECLMKIFTYGFIMNGPYSYLKDLWDALDFIILIFSYLCLTSWAESFKVVKTFRILRSLRLIGKNEGLKVAVRALLFAIPNILNITVIMVMFHSIFAIVLISNFKGKMFICTNQSTDIGHLASKWDCLNHGGIWS